MNGHTPCITQLFDSVFGHKTSLLQRRKLGSTEGSDVTVSKRSRSSLSSTVSVNHSDASSVGDDMESVSLHSSSRLSSASSSSVTECAILDIEPPQCPVLVLKSIWKIQEDCEFLEASGLVSDRTALQRKLSDL